ncbi:hypothetical protein [Capybara microvirus Cap1_SP_142]|nr:hypothetical protein [Capybara microvirus Cap1_SP_142]
MTNQEKALTFEYDGKTIKYGDPLYMFDLKWHDEKEMDYLMIVGVKPYCEAIEARAKGVTPYELIDTYGGIDNVETVLPVKGQYLDVSEMPEIGNDLAYEQALNTLQAKLDELKKTKLIQEEKPKEEDK